MGGLVRKLEYYTPRKRREKRGCSLKRRRFFWALHFQVNCFLLSCLSILSKFSATNIDLGVKENGKYFYKDMWLRPVAVPSETTGNVPLVDDCSRVLTGVIRRHQDSHQGTAKGSGTHFCPRAHSLWREEARSLYPSSSAAHLAGSQLPLTPRFSQAART